jgi:hypothetical protein
MGAWPYILVASRWIETKTISREFSRTLHPFVAADHIATILETDPARVSHRLVEAIAAIEQRLLSPVEAGSDEEKALKQAQRVVAAPRERSEQWGVWDVHGSPRCSARIYSTRPIVLADSLALAYNSLQFA